MSEPENIGRQLRALRRGAGLTQAALAERLECSPKRIANIEGGARRPQLELIARWAEVCDRRFVFGFPPPGDASYEVILAAGALQTTPLAARRAIEAILAVAPYAPEGALDALEGHIEAWQVCFGARPDPRTTGR